MQSKRKKYGSWRVQGEDLVRRGKTSQEESAIKDRGVVEAKIDDRSKSKCAGFGCDDYGTDVKLVGVWS